MKGDTGGFNMMAQCIICLKV